MLSLGEQIMLQFANISFVRGGRQMISKESLSLSPSSSLFTRKSCSNYFKRLFKTPMSVGDMILNHKQAAQCSAVVLLREILPPRDIWQCCRHL